MRRAYREDNQWLSIPKTDPSPPGGQGDEHPTASPVSHLAFALVREDCQRSIQLLSIRPALWVKPMAINTENGPITPRWSILPEEIDPEGGSDGEQLMSWRIRGSRLPFFFPFRQSGG
jgi:hypothetical protein